MKSVFKNIFLVFVFLIFLVFVFSLQIFYKKHATFNNRITNLKTSEDLSARVANGEVDKGVYLYAVGDVMLGRSVNTLIQKTKDPNLPFEKVVDVFDPSDILLINLENPLTDPCPITNSGMVFCAPTSSVSGLSFLGVDIVNLSNNHARNFGDAGYQTTITALQSEEVFYGDEQTPAFINKNGTTFAFIGFNLTFGGIDENMVVQGIINAKKGADVLIASFHWGEEYKFTPNKIQKKYAHLAIDNGTDLVIGHHPHVVQLIEFYNEKLIVYSLGNFVFDQLWSEETREGVIAKFHFVENGLVDYEFIPVYINDSYQPEVVVDPEKKSKILLRTNQL